MKQRMFPRATKTIIIVMKTIDLVLEPKPITIVKKLSEIKAQMRAPPLSKPVTWASPMGKLI